MVPGQYLLRSILAQVCCFTTSTTIYCTIPRLEVAEKRIVVVKKVRSSQAVASPEMPPSKDHLASTTEHDDATTSWLHLATERPLDIYYGISLRCCTHSCFLQRLSSASAAAAPGEVPSKMPCLQFGVTANHFSMTATSHSLAPEQSSSIRSCSLMLHRGLIRFMTALQTPCAVSTSGRPNPWMNWQYNLRPQQPEDKTFRR
jgi:hypothetical protein